MSTLRARREHLPADIFGLSDVARTALATGLVSGVPVARTLSEIPRPKDRHPEPVRQELAHALRSGLEEVFGPGGLPGRASTSLEVLAREGSFAVLTGQQPGLYAGPLYTLYKAMQACRLASELSRDWGVPVVPIFWNHGEDHDISEVNHTYLVNRNMDVQKAGLANLPAGRTPISQILVDAEEQRLADLRALFAHTYGDHVSIDWALDLCEPRAGESLARALTRTLTELLGEHGLVVVEPDWIRGELSRALATIISRDPRAALQASAKLEHPAAIDPKRGAMVFRVDPKLGRQPLRLGGEGYRYDDELGSRTPEELAAEIVDDPSAWSAGGLLRPIVQDAVFPACAYIGGWGELAYHAQLAAARGVCEVPRTAFVPRVSATLLDPDVSGSLTKIGAKLGQALQAAGKFEAPGQSENEPEAFANLRKISADARRQLMTQRESLAALDPSLGLGLKKTASQMERAVEKLLTKAMRVHATQSGHGDKHIRRLNHHLMPRGKPQERVLGPVPYLARWGKDFVDALWSEWPAICIEHLGVFLELQEDIQ